MMLLTNYQMTHEISISISYSYVQTIVEILFIELSYMLVITGSEKPLHYEYSYEILGLKPPFPSLPPSISHSSSSFLPPPFSRQNPAPLYRRATTTSKRTATLFGKEKKKN